MERKIYVYGFEFGFHNPQRSFKGYALSSPIYKNIGFTRSSKDEYELVGAVNDVLKKFPDSVLINSIPRIPVYLGKSLAIYAGGKPTLVMRPDETVNNHIMTMDLSDIEKIVVNNDGMHYVYRTLSDAEIPADIKSFFLKHETS